MTKKNKIFMEITNKDIFDKINLLIDNNTKQHGEIVIHQKETNGKVKRNYLVAMGAMSLSVILLGFLFQYIVGG